jgi:hypothetical protein
MRGKVFAEQGRHWSFAPVRMLQVAMCVGLLGAALAPAAKADAWNLKTIVTFNTPVESPGQVLSAGTYVFKIMDNTANRHVVRIFNQDQTHVYATLLAIPDFRLEPTGQTAIQFEERAARAPEAVHSWFYPGRRYGEEFIYPQAATAPLSSSTIVNSPTMSSGS